MQRAQRLQANADFQRVRREGRSWAHPLLVLAVGPGRSPVGQTRVGVTAGRRVGGAVTRNRLKRRVREATRLRYDQLVPGKDIVFIVRPAAAGASYATIAKAVESLLDRAGLISVEATCSESPSV